MCLLCVDTVALLNSRCDPTMPRMFFNRRVRPSVFVTVLLWWWSVGVQACAICAPSDAQNTVVQRLFAADRIVLAQMDADGVHARAVAAMRGVMPEFVIAVAGTLPGVEPQRARLASDPHLLVFNSGSQTWWIFGRIGVDRLQWLAEATRLSTSRDGTRDAVLARGRFFAQHLEDPEPLIALAAYEEISVLPYSTLRLLAKQVNAASMGIWIENPSLRARLPLYYLLWGFQTSAEIASAIEVSIAKVNTETPGPELSAMLAALLEQRGSPALDWIEHRFLRDPAVPEGQVQAALLALSVHGFDAVKITRDQVVEAYKRFIAANPRRAGFVASDLGSWERWEFAPVFASALESAPNQVFASRYSVVFYLLRNPNPEAKSELERLRSAGLL